MTDFTNMPHKQKAYGGADRSKICIEYENELYMLKFPVRASQNKDMYYMNSCISEYIGCHIFNEVGIPAQETLLGTYEKEGKNKIVVACKDMTTSGLLLQDFASLKNAIIDSEHNGHGTELKDIEQTFSEQQAMDSVQLSEHFWNTFVIDALIGNSDRNNGNWGFLYDVATDAVRLAPVYACGNSLFPQADESKMMEVIKNKAALNHRIYIIPLSAIQQDGKKINYYNFITSLQNEGCNRALLRMVSRINMEKISEIVDATPYISVVQKDFYKMILNARKEFILDFALAQLKG